jgi:hypothetical protein
MGIFRHLRNCEDIKRLRLSSQRLNETSSHLLINTLYVSPNPKSLERLNQVSRHPAISRGVRRLVASIDVYSPELARDVQSFTAWCIEELAEIVSRQTVARYKAIQIWRSWHYFQQSFSDPHSDGMHLDEHHTSAVYSGWLR